MLVKYKKIPSINDVVEQRQYGGTYLDKLDEFDNRMMEETRLTNIEKKEGRPEG